MKKRIISLLLAVVMIVGMLPLSAITAFAADTGEIVPYLVFDEDGSFTEKHIALSGLTVIDAESVPLKDNKLTGDNGGFYLVRGNVSISEYVTVSGDVSLILENGCDITFEEGIRLEKGNFLTVCGQTQDIEEMGHLTATGKGLHAGIGSAGGSIGIWGDSWDAVSFNDSADCGAFILHGAVVDATAEHGAGLGGGAGDVKDASLRIKDPGYGSEGSDNHLDYYLYAAGGAGGDVSVYAGILSASSEDISSGIGGGQGGKSNALDYDTKSADGAGGSFRFYGGAVFAESKNGYAVGGCKGDNKNAVFDLQNEPVIYTKNTPVPIAAQYYAENHRAYGNISIHGGTRTVYLHYNSDAVQDCEIAVPYCKTVDLSSSPDWEGLCVYTWYLDEELTEVFDPETRIDRDLDLYALWEEPRDGYRYIAYDESGNGNNYQISKNKVSVIDAQNNRLDNGKLNGGWYIVQGDVTIEEYVTILDAVHIILENGCHINFTQGINLEEGKELHLYAQTKNLNGMGQLTAIGKGNNAGIGSVSREISYDELNKFLSDNVPLLPTAACGTFVMHGGVVTASAENGAGIGGGKGVFLPGLGTFRLSRDGGAGGTVTVYSGKLTAKSLGDSAGIGGGAGGDIADHKDETRSYIGKGGDGAQLNIYGGIVTAESVYFSAFGGGKGGSMPTDSFYSAYIYAQNGETGTLNISDNAKVYVGNSTTPLAQQDYAGVLNNSAKVTIKDASTYSVGLHYGMASVSDTSFSVVYGDKITKPADPEISGFILSGWYKDPSFKNEWDFDTDVVCENITLYAKCVQNELAPDENGVYHIYDGSGWTLFDQMVKGGDTFKGITVLLENDITIHNLIGGFNSNADADRPFSGTFDGQGNTITIDFDWTNGSDKGAFSHTNGGAVIKNLTVDGEIEGDWSMGGIVGNASATTFLNCTSNVAVTGHNEYAGGIAGYACNGTRFENCTSYGNVVGNKCVGGIAGLSDSGTTYYGCVNYGDVTGNENVGGIIGRVSTNKSGDFVSALLNCISCGNIKTTCYAGGIIGYEDGPVSVKNAHVFGTMSSSSNGYAISSHSNENSVYELCVYNKGPASSDEHGVSIAYDDIIAYVNDYIFNNDKLSEGWLTIELNSQSKPVFVYCLHGGETTVSYKWKTNPASCTAKLICNDCGSVIQSETIGRLQLTYIDHSAEKCTELGYYYYVADFKDPLFETQTSGITYTDYGPHHYVDGYCMDCPAEQPVDDAKQDAIKAIKDAAGDSTDMFVTALVNAAVAEINKEATDTVAKVIEIKNKGIAAIEKQLGTGSHTHIFADTYSHNDTHHWRVCTCGDEKCKNLVDGFAVHTFGEGVVDGNKTTYTCSVCGYEKIVYNGGSTEGEPVQGVVKCDGISLTLSSDIYINFYMQLTDEALANGKMVFTIGNRTVEGVTAQLNESNGRYYFACPLNALEMAETVKAEFTYGSTKYVQEYSVEKYVKAILGGDYTDKMKDLARSIANYGYYAQLYLESIHTNVTIGGENGYKEMLGDFKDYISTDDALNLTDRFTATANTANLTFDGRTVYFDSATALNFYVISENGKPNATCDKNKTVEVKLYSGNTYIVSVKDITATELADTYTVTVSHGEDTMTLKGSVLDYCAAVMNAHRDKDADKDVRAVNAMAAFYEYYDAAVKYVSPASN